MITINPVNFVGNKNITFGANNNNMSKVDNYAGVRLLNLDKNSNNKINFEKDMYISQKADFVQSNPIKAIGYNIVKAYNMLSTPRRNAVNAETNYVHIPYMA